jgi:hypothetical protein
MEVAVVAQAVGEGGVVCRRGGGPLEEEGRGEEALVLGDSRGGWAEDVDGWSGGEEQPKGSGGEDGGHFG